MVFRPAFSEEEDGQNTLVKLYAGYCLSYRDQRSEERSNGTNSKTIAKSTCTKLDRLFLGRNEKGSKDGEGKFQLHIPSDNPLLGFVELVHLIAEAYPVVLEIQNVHHTFDAVSTIKALIHRAAQSSDTKLLTIISSVPLEENTGWVSQPLQMCSKKKMVNMKP